MSVPHHLSSQPSLAWDELKRGQKFVKLKVKAPSSSVEGNKVRFVCMSDTHSLVHKIRFHIPDGDVFIHAGDFTRCGTLKEVQQFNDWLGTLSHRYKVVIAGNHELSFDETFCDSSSTHGKAAVLSPSFPCLGVPREDLLEASASETATAKKLLTNAIYLEDSAVVVYGIKIYGSPWQPEFCHWAFNLPRGQPCLDKWNQIPSDTDVLLTHGPPVGHGDLTASGVRAGCVDLLSEVQQRILPKYHVFGHIHEGYGVTTDGRVVYVNASTCDVHYTPKNIPITFDIPLPPGATKT